jgi:hypothetical protein
MVDLSATKEFNFLQVQNNEKPDSAGSFSTITNNKSLGKLCKSKTISLRVANILLSQTQLEFPTLQSGFNRDKTAIFSDPLFNDPSNYDLLSSLLI